MLELLPRTWEMWRLGGLTPWRALKRAGLSFQHHGLDGRSAQSAYYGLALLPPTLFLLITVLAWLPGDGLLDAIARDSERALPADTFDVVERQLDGVREHQSPGFFGLALAAFLISGVYLFTSVSRALNAMHGVQETRRFWTVWSLATLLGFGAFLLLLASALLLFFGPLLQLPFSDGIRVLIICGAALLSVSVIYWMMPNVKQRWMPLTPGNTLAVGAWLFVSLGFRLYVEHFDSYNATYGALAGVILLMVWLQLTGMAFYFGAQLNAVILNAMGENHGVSPALRGRPLE